MSTANSDLGGSAVNSEGTAGKGGWAALRMVLAACLTSLLLSALVCFLPTSSYQRWELTGEHWYNHLLWCFERIHFDPTPIDVAIVGTSKALFGIDPVRFEQKLSELGFPAHVANLAKMGAGRNVDWAIVQELLAARVPRLLIVGIEDQPYPWGHVAFKDLATARDLIAPPAPFLHDYAADLAPLPKRQVRLFAASYFPELFGLHRDFDRRRYDDTALPWNAEEWVDDLVTTNRKVVQPAEKLIAERKRLETPTTLDRLFLRCCNDGDDKVYLRAIAELANAKGIPLLFVHTPMYQGRPTAEEAGFVSQFGPLVDGAAIEDLRNDSSNYENWRHFNRIGAGRLTDRLATIVANMRIVASRTPLRN